MKTPEEIFEIAKKTIDEADDERLAEELRVRFLGKKGEITELLKVLGTLSPDERRQLGMKVNKLKKDVETLIEEKKHKLAETGQEARLAQEKIDVSEPGRASRQGTKHILTITIDDICSIFQSFGYSVTEGPEVETVFHNFDALNAAPNHPSRDLTDTFYITEDTLLRPQTSPVQVRTLLSKKPPIKVISPGRCFRADTPDATHSPMFHQVEGMLVDEGVTMADLKGMLDLFARRMFTHSGTGSEDVRTRFRPHFFPFTEPSAEMDMSCFLCDGSEPSCRVCRGGGWIEILGCGMVHPNVLKVGGIDTDRYTGFAFGMGVERIAMLKHGVEDIRMFYENDIRFVGQFY